MFGWLEMSDVSPEFLPSQSELQKYRADFHSFLLLFLSLSVPELDGWTILFYHGAEKHLSYSLNNSSFQRVGARFAEKKQVGRSKHLVWYPWKCMTFRTKDSYLNIKSATFLLGNLNKSLPYSESELPPSLENEEGNVYLTGCWRVE